MTICLSDHEAGAKYHGDYDADLKSLQKRLERIQVAHVVRGPRAIVMLEGWDAAGKGGILHRLTARWDPRHFTIHPVAAPTAEERSRHFLWRFWRDLPADGSIALFDRSWYGRVLVERVEGFATPAEWQRGYDEINAFETQQIASGTTLVKLFVHVTQEEQDKRLRARIDDPWKRWKTGADDFHNRSRRAAYLEAMAEMFARTDTPQAPWIAIDGNNKKVARIAALTAIAERLEAAVWMEPPPLTDELAALQAELVGE
jgi:polyphosphate kinase 2 (PPK2 family)